MNQTLLEKIAGAEPKLDDRLKKIRAVYKHLALSFTFRSVDYLLNVEEISMQQLRSCSFIMSDDKIIYDVDRAAILCIKAGLVGSKQCDANNIACINEKTAEIVDSWLNNVGSLSVLYLLSMEQMEKVSFFMSSVEMNLMNEMLKSSSSLEHLMENVSTQAVTADTMYLRTVSEILSQMI